MLDKVDKRIAELVKKRAGSKLDQVLATAEQLVTHLEKKPARALADALEFYKLTKGERYVSQRSTDASEES